MNKLPEDPRLPMLGGMDYERALYSRLYDLFRNIAQVVNAIETGGGGSGGIVILGTYASFGALVAAHPTGTAGDYYTINNDLYGWVGGAWANLATLKGDPGTNGTNGQEVSLQKTATHIQWRLGTGTWTNLVLLDDLKGVAGDDGLEVSLQKTATHIQWRLGTGSWVNLVALVDLKGDTGDDGLAVSLQKTATHIQWRLGTGAWTDLVALADLKGDKGDTGAGSAAVDVSLTAITGLTATDAQAAFAEVMARIINIETKLNTARTYDTLGNSYGV